MSTTNREKVYETWLKCQRLSDDISTTSHEREAASTKAKELRKKLDALDGETKPAANAARFRSLVKQGKALIEEQVNVNWKLGELASTIDKEYGQNKLKEFADEIGVSASSLKDCRTTYIAWPQKAGRPAFSIARALNPHPFRFDVLAKNPNITQAEAKAKVQEYWEKNAKQKQKKRPAVHVRGSGCNYDADDPRDVAEPGDTPAEIRKSIFDNRVSEGLRHAKEIWEGRPALYGMENADDSEITIEIIDAAGSVANAWLELVDKLQKRSDAHKQKTSLHLAN
jgi:hypothetical protein